ncbi:A-agglutinin anchorage subunit-like [Lytechinus variegatus]|uniref:A-agglutinin anchorage subunit-like n=1 Tax=Lytechinus variegatus TaxID=7654 RepID=UPI001BB141EE|nr:A-agglutinin anchorage subunit-like [Lytechinus variegatus]
MITSRTNKPPPTDKFTDTTTHMYTESTVPATILQTSRPTTGYSSLENSTSMTPLPSKATGTSSTTSFTTTQKQMHSTKERSSDASFERPGRASTESKTPPSLSTSQLSTGQTIHSPFSQPSSPTFSVDNSLETSTSRTLTQATWSTQKAHPHPPSRRVHSSTVAPSTTTMLNEQKIKGDKAYIVLSKRVVLAVAVGVSVVLIFMMASIVALIGRQGFRSQSGQIERNITRLDSTHEGFTSFAAHLNHDYERTITRTQDSTSTDDEVGTLTYPINSLPLPHRRTPPSSHDYEEVEGHLINTFKGDYMLPDVQEGSLDGYLDMVSNVKKGDACGNALPLVTFRNKMTERPTEDENGYLVPNVEQYRSRDM